MADELSMTISIEGADTLSKSLSQLGLDMKDLRGAMQDTGRTLSQFFGGQVFASRGGIIGEPWPGLSAAYAAEKAKRYPGRPPLVVSGRMQRSFTYRSTNTTVTIGNSAPYFVYHQSSAPRHHLPRRVMLKLDAQRKSDITRIIATSLAKKVQARMGK